ncbi:MAG: hypothetical protein PVF65_01340 [Sphingomonadales bacterium]|jgi:hypothetical protein
MIIEMNKRDDDWLDFALRQKPQIADDGFSAAFMARLEKNRRRRWIILLACVIPGLIIAVLNTPWTFLFNWINKNAMLSAKLAPGVEAQAMTIDWLSLPVLSILLILAIGAITLFASQAE